MPFDPLTHVSLLLLTEQIGLAEYPGLSALAYTPPSQPSLRAAIAFRAQRSLLLRLLARRPWHARELCQLQIGHTLFCEAGGWYLAASAAESGLGWSAGLKSAGGGCAFPDELVASLEEFLTVWRPMLLEEACTPLFITRAGGPYTTSTLNREVVRIFRRYTRQSIGLPQICQSWTSARRAMLQLGQLPHRLRRGS